MIRLASFSCALFLALLATNSTAHAQCHEADLASDDFLGDGVALHEDVIVVGATRSDALIVGAQNDDDFGNLTGAVYSFERNGSVWQESAKLVASDGESGDQLARDIALWGDIVVLGAFGDDDGGSNAGAAYVFEADAGNWSQVLKMVPIDSVAGDRFGRATDAYGNTLVIGAPLVDAAGTNAGRMRVYSLGRATAYCTGATNSRDSPQHLAPAASCAWMSTLPAPRGICCRPGAPGTSRPGSATLGPAARSSTFRPGCR